MSVSVEPYQLAILIAVVAYVAFQVGRATKGGEADPQRRMLENERIDQAIAALDPNQRDEIMRLVGGRKKINAIKVMRAASGLGLREAKIAVERMAMTSGTVGDV